MSPALITIIYTFIILQKYKNQFNIARILFHANRFLYIINVNPTIFAYVIVKKNGGVIIKKFLSSFISIILSIFAQ